MIHALFRDESDIHIFLVGLLLRSVSTWKIHKINRRAGARLSSVSCNPPIVHGTMRDPDDYVALFVSCRFLRSYIFHVEDRRARRAIKSFYDCRDARRIYFFLRFRSASPDLIVVAREFPPSLSLSLFLETVVLYLYPWKITTVR